MQEIQVVYLVMSEFPESLTEAGEKARPEEYKTLRKRACAYNKNLIELTCMFGPQCENIGLVPSLQVYGPSLNKLAKK